MTDTPCTYVVVASSSFDVVLRVLTPPIGIWRPELDFVPSPATENWERPSPSGLPTGRAMDKRHMNHYPSFVVFKPNRTCDFPFWLFWIDCGMEVPMSRNSNFLHRVLINPASCLRCRHWKFQLTPRFHGLPALCSTRIFRHAQPVRPIVAIAIFNRFLRSWNGSFVKKLVEILDEMHEMIKNFFLFHQIHTYNSYLLRPLTTALFTRNSQKSFRANSFHYSYFSKIFSLIPVPIISETWFAFYLYYLNVLEVLSGGKLVFFSLILIFTRLPKMGVSETWLILTVVLNHPSEYTHCIYYIIELRPEFSIDSWSSHGIGEIHRDFETFSARIRLKKIAKFVTSAKLDAIVDQCTSHFFRIDLYWLQPIIVLITIRVTDHIRRIDHSSRRPRRFAHSLPFLYPMRTAHSRFHCTLP